ncbi:hypothetical protein D3C71_1502920 [compost metagenome]
MKATTLPIANGRYWNRRRSIKGLRPVWMSLRCQAMKPATASAAPNNKPPASATEPPCSDTSPLSRHSVPTVPNKRPRQSSASPCRFASTPPGAVTGTNL